MLQLHKVIFFYRNHILSAALMLIFLYRNIFFDIKVKQYQQSVNIKSQFNMNLFQKYSNLYSTLNSITKPEKTKPKYWYKTYLQANKIKYQNYKNNLCYIFLFYRDTFMCIPLNIPIL